MGARLDQSLAEPDKGLMAKICRYRFSGELRCGGIRGKIRSGLPAMGAVRLPGHSHPFRNGALTGKRAPKIERYPGHTGCGRLVCLGWDSGNRGRIRPLP